MPEHDLTEKRERRRVIKPLRCRLLGHKLSLPISADVMRGARKNGLKGYPNWYVGRPGPRWCKRKGCPLSFDGQEGHE